MNNTIPHSTRCLRALGGYNYEPNHFLFHSTKLRYLIAFIVLSATSAFAVAVDIPDLVLEDRIRSKLSKPENELTTDDLELLTEISAEGVADLSGIEFAKNLTTAYFDRATMSDLSPLATLTNLVTLRIRGKNLNNLAPLAGLENLATLHLEGGTISNLEPLSGLLNLETLIVNHTSVNDIAPLFDLTKLVHLELNYADIVNISPITGLLELRFLCLNGNRIQDIDGLASLVNLEGLELDNNEISRIDIIPMLEKLEVASLRSNHINDLEPFTELSLLSALYLDNNEITDLEPLNGIGRLISILELSRNRITDLTTFGDQSRISGQLDVSYNFIDHSEGSPQKEVIDYLSRVFSQVFTGVPPIWFPQNYDSAGFKDEALENAVRVALEKPEGEIIVQDLLELTELEASGEGIEDLSGLQHAFNLNRLDLSHNSINDISKITGFNMTYLDLSHNQILFSVDSKLSKISWADDIEYINMSNNFLTFVFRPEPLERISAIGTLDLTCNPIDFYESRSKINSINQLAESVDVEILFGGDCYEVGVLYQERLKQSGDQLFFWLDEWELQYSSDLETWKRVSSARIGERKWLPGVWYRYLNLPEGPHYWRLRDNSLN